MARVSGAILEAGYDNVIITSGKEYNSVSFSFILTLKKLFFYLIFIYLFFHLIFIYLFIFSFIFISWRLITLQYCSGFCYTLT